MKILTNNHTRIIILLLVLILASQWFMITIALDERDLKSEIVEIRPENNHFYSGTCYLLTKEEGFVLKALPYNKYSEDLEEERREK